MVDVDTAVGVAGATLAVGTTVAVRVAARAAVAVATGVAVGRWLSLLPPHAATAPTSMSGTTRCQTCRRIEPSSRDHRFHARVEPRGDRDRFRRYRPRRLNIAKDAVRRRALNGQFSRSCGSCTGCRASCTCGYRAPRSACHSSPDTLRLSRCVRSCVLGPRAARPPSRAPAPCQRAGRPRSQAAAS